MSTAGSLTEISKRVIRLSCAAGYTLVELIVVVLLISMFLGIGLPRLKYFLFRDDMKTSARQLIASISMCRSNALWKQTPCSLKIELGTGRYRLDFQGTTPAEEIEEVFRQEENEENIFNLPAGIIVDRVWTADFGARAEGEADLSFTSKGYTRQAHIRLHSESGEIMTLNIEPFLQSITVSQTWEEMD